MFLNFNLEVTLGGGEFLLKGSVSKIMMSEKYFFIYKIYKRIPMSYSEASTLTAMGSRQQREK